MSKEEIMAYLLENFGIKSEAELLEAMRSAEPLNIGIMTSKRKEDD